MKTTAIYKKLLMTTLFVICLHGITEAQTTLLNQQWYSRVNRNPAAAASSPNEDVNLSLFYRNQWTGVDGAPQTILLNADTYFDKLRSGFGLSLNNDMEGESFNNFNALFSYAYRIPFNQNWQLSLGLAGGLNYFSNNLTNNSWADPNDPNVMGLSNESFLSADINFGAEMVAFQRLTVGAAVDHLLNNEAKTTAGYKSMREFYVYGRYNLALPAHFELAPMVAWIYNEQDKSIVQAGATATYDKLCWLGVNWGSNSAVAFLAGVEWKKLRFGYSYQLSYGDVGNLAASTHEFMLQFSFGKGK